VFLISSNIAVSLICNFITKRGEDLHFNFDLASGFIAKEKHPSASAKPVINQGFNLRLRLVCFLCSQWPPPLLLEGGQQRQEKVL
jgi:hypothetical protein